MAAPTEPYTMREALHEAARLLIDEFGDAKQDATVSLATFLYHAHERDEFMRRKEESEEPTRSIM